MSLRRHLIQVLTFDLLLCLVLAQNLTCPYEECICGRDDSTSYVVCIEALTTFPKLTNESNIAPVTLVEISSHQIKEIPKNSLPPGVIILYITENPISYVDPAAFNGSTSTLRELYMSNAVFTELPEALLTLKNLTTFSLGNTSIQNWNTTILSHIGKTLEYLSLSEVDLNPYPEGLKSLTVLKYFEMNNVDINDIPNDAFTKMKDSLRSLILESSNVSHIPTALLELTNLSLHLKNNKLEKLENIPQVTFLDVDYNLLSDANNIVHVLQASTKSLQTLHVSYNQLTSIPNLSNFSILADVKLDHNNITSDSEPILQASFSKVEILTISYNGLTFFPNISTFPELRSLFLDHNRIVSDAKSDSQVLAKKLETLVLSYNQLTSISNLPRSPVLKTVSLDNNNLSDLSLDWLQPSANSLETLICSYNLLTVIGDLSSFSVLKNLILTSNNISTLGSLPSNLESLQLQGNRLDFIPSVITGLSKLSTLNLASNFITEFNSTDIPSQLQGLNLSSNLISRLYENSFPENCSLRYLYLQDNPIEYIADSAFDNVNGLVILDLSRTYLINLPLALSSLSHLQYLSMYNISTLICPCPMPKSLSQWFRGLPPLYQIKGYCGNKPVEIGFAFFVERFYGFQCETTPTALVETTTKKNNMGVILMIDPRSLVLYLLLYISLVHQI